MDSSTQVFVLSNLARHSERSEESSDFYWILRAFCPQDDVSKTIISEHEVR